MAIVSPIIKTIQERIDELRDVTALLERAKVEHADVIAAMERTKKEMVDQHAHLDKRTQLLNAEQAKFNESVDRTHVALSESVDSLNRKAIEYQAKINHAEDNIKNLQTRIAELEGILRTLQANVSAETEVHKNLLLENEQLKSQVTETKKEVDRINQLAAEEQKKLDVLVEEERLANTRKQDLALYEQRLIALYKEQGIDLKI